MDRPGIMYTLDDYDYPLPADLVAQAPADRRDGSRLLHLDRKGGRREHRRFPDIVDLLSPSDVLVINDTRVVPGRLHGRKETGGRAELLILDYGQRRSADPRCYECLIKASKQAAVGTRIFFETGLVAVVDAAADRIYTVRFEGSVTLDDAIARIGQMPLPPYIKRDAAQPAPSDRTRYQTVYASESGAIAAPTAGLHFTETILSRIREKGITIARVTLHVGYGTFVPVRVDDIREHRMHEEWFSIPEETAHIVNQAKSEGRRVVAVGTTSVRTLEWAARKNGFVDPGSGYCDLFIYPGYAFKMVDAMLTNFHLPRSTLLLLVSAFAGRETMLQAYAEAIRKRYRFFSYGDAMLIE